MRNGFKALAYFVLMVGLLDSHPTQGSTPGVTPDSE